MITAVVDEQSAAPHDRGLGAGRVSQLSLPPVALVLPRIACARSLLLYFQRRTDVLRQPLAVFVIPCFRLSPSLAVAPPWLLPRPRRPRPQPLRSARPRLPPTEPRPREASSRAATRPSTTPRTPLPSLSSRCVDPFHDPEAREALSRWRDARTLTLGKGWNHHYRLPSTALPSLQAPATPGHC